MWGRQRREEAQVRPLEGYRQWLHKNSRSNDRVPVIEHVIQQGSQALDVAYLPAFTDKDVDRATACLSCKL